MPEGSRFLGIVIAIYQMIRRVAGTLFEQE